MELKTQKELVKEHLKKFPYSYTIMDFQIREKKEAIKWVKENRKPKNVEITEREFMKFHNITEEDLK